MDVRGFSWFVLAMAACGGGDGTGTAGDDDDAVGDDDDAVGDDDDDTTGVEVLTCDDGFSACGGDPVGVWNVEAVCALEMPDLDCPDLVISLDADRSGGTVTLSGDGSYDRVYDVDVDVSATIPKTCVAPAPCNLVAAASGGLLSACTDDGDNCACTGTVQYTDAANGTWTQAGTQLLFDGGETTLDYCVAGPSALTRDSDGVITVWGR